MATEVSAILKGVRLSPQKARLVADLVRGKKVDYAWRIVDPILQTWANERDYVVNYPAGSWGPEDSRLFEKSVQSWRSSLTPECK